MNRKPPYSCVATLAKQWYQRRVLFFFCSGNKL
uniref:Uncharacterized protein n=1 Tax=Anguilla anguilla TaxID=7936 RepID=A0A0E9VYU7_ANGAN